MTFMTRTILVTSLKTIASAVAAPIFGEVEAGAQRPDPGGVSTQAAPSIRFFSAVVSVPPQRAVAPAPAPRASGKLIVHAVIIVGGADVQRGRVHAPAGKTQRQPTASRGSAEPGCNQPS